MRMPSVELPGLRRAPRDEDSCACRREEDSTPSAAAGCCGCGAGKCTCAATASCLSASALQDLTLPARLPVMRLCASAPDALTLPLCALTVVCLRRHSGTPPMGLGGGAMPQQGGGPTRSWPLSMTPTIMDRSGKRYRPLGTKGGGHTRQGRGFWYGQWPVHNRVCGGVVGEQVQAAGGGAVRVHARKQCKASAKRGNAGSAGGGGHARQGRGSSGGQWPKRVIGCVMTARGAWCSND